MTLTNEQLLAVKNNDKSICISAGAGSGKTRVLVEKYWKLLELGFEVDEIMAVTFTRKAAQEMVERIRRKIEESDLNYARKRELKEALNQAWIGTIDSICSRIIKEYPIETQTDPFFHIAEEVTLNQLKYEMARNIVIDAINKQDEVVLAYVETFGYSRLLIDMLGLLSIATSKGLQLEHMESLTYSSIDQVVTRLAPLTDDLIQIYMNVLANLPHVNPKTKTYAAVEKMQANQAEWVRALHSIGRFTCDKADYDILDLLFVIGKGNPAKEVKADLKEMQRLITIVKGIITDYGNREYLTTLFSLTKRLGEDLAAAKMEANILEFADLIDKVVRLLQDYPDILSIFQGQFKQIMVDEFQDTNYRQVDFVRTISHDFTTPVFAVGDPKQSIYRFRGAEVNLFTEVMENVEKVGGLNSSLSMNFRTRENLMQLVNDVFAEIMQDSRIGFQALGAARPSHQSNFAEIHLIHPQFSIEVEADEAEAYCIVARINEIINNREVLVYEKSAGEERPRPPRYSDIAILFQKSKNMDICTSILKEYSIPYYIVGSRGFFDTEEVNNIILFLKTVNDVSDEKSLVGILRSQMLGVSDESLWFIKQRYSSLNKGLSHLEEYVQDIKASDYEALELAEKAIFHLRLNKSRLSINEIITYIMDVTDYAKFLAQQANGEQKIINLQKLLNMAQSKEVEYIHTIKEFLEYVAQVKASTQAESQAILDSETSNTVKLMTVHQAKGLEFPIVFLPFMHQRFNVSDVSDNLIFGHKLGVFLRTEEKGYLRELAEIEEEELMLEEYMRVLYVAKTRACDYLVMSGTYDIKENSEGELIARTNKQSWLKWLFDYFGVKDIPINHYFERANIQTFIYEGSDIEKIMQQELGSGDSPETVSSISEYDFNFTGEYDEYEFLSATRLIDYEFCPYFVYLKYGKGLGMATSGRQQGAEDIDELDAAGRGLIIHAIIEKHDNLSAARDSLQHILEGSKFLVEDTEKALMISMLENYYENDYIAELTGKSKVLKEVPFIARLAGKRFISGFVDQLWLDDNHYNIIDLKTGNVREEYTSQLNIYQLALDKILSQKLKNKDIFYLRAGKLAKAEDQDINLELDKTPLPEKTIACKSCNYQFICFPDWGEEL